MSSGTAKSPGRELRVGYLMADPGVDLRRFQGCRIHVEGIVHGLRAAGHEVRLVANQPDGSLQIDEGDGRVREIAPDDDPAPRLSAPLWFAAETQGLPRAEIVPSDRVFRAANRVFRGCDLVHARMAPFDIAAGLCARELGLPLVLEVNAPPLEEARAFYPELLQYRSERLARFAAESAFARARAVVAVSSTLRDMLAAQWQVEPAKLFVLPNAAHARGEALSAERAHALRGAHELGEGPTVVFLGALQPWHGVDVLLQALARVAPEAPSVRVLLVGDGPERSRLEALTASLGLEAFVRFVGEVEHAQALELLAVADVAVAPYPPLSLDFYFSPLKLFEYMAAGKAIVASRIGQVGEIVRDEHDGLLTTPGHVEELAAALQRLLADDALRERLGCNARETAEREHTWERYIERLTAIYGEAMGETARG